MHSDKVSRKFRISKSRPAMHVAPWRHSRLLDVLIPSTSLTPVLEDPPSRRRTSRLNSDTNATLAQRDRADDVRELQQ